MHKGGKGFGDELRRRRTAASLSLRDLAGLVHYSRGYLSKVETGQASASIQLARLCDAALQAGGELVALAIPRHHQPLAAAGHSGVTWGLRETCSSAVCGEEPPAESAADLARAMLPIPCLPSQSQTESIAEGFMACFLQLRVLGQVGSPLRAATW